MEKNRKFSHFFFLFFNKNQQKNEKKRKKRNGKKRGNNFSLFVFHFFSLFGITQNMNNVIYYIKNENDVIDEWSLQ